MALSYLKFFSLGLFLLLPPFSHAQRLEQLINSSLVSHPSSQGQQALVQSAQAGVEGARWQFYPTPSLSVETVNASTTDRAYQGDNRVVIARIQQPLWAGGRLTAGMDKAQASLVSNQASFDEMRLQLALRVIQAYGDWLSAHGKGLANEKSLLTHKKLQEQVQRRLGEGASAESDLTLAISRLEAVTAEVSASRAQQEVALARLGQLLGSKVDGSLLYQNLAAPRSVAGTLQDLLDMALSNNPTLAKAKAQAQVQETTVRERRADLSPEIFARIERQYGNYSYLDTAPENRVFLGVSTRLGAGLSTMSNIEAALKQHAAALAEVDVQTRTINEQVLSDYAQASSIDARIKATVSSLAAAKDVAFSYDRQYLAGRKTWLDVMNAARELAQTEAQLVELQSIHVVVTWRLAAYTQGVQALMSEAN